MNINEISKDFADYAALLEFCTAQQATILSISKQLVSLETKNKHLEDLLSKTSPLLVKEQSEPLTEMFLSSDEESICRMQLQKLRDVSIERELTLEESRKVEIYSKILLQLQNKPKTIRVEAQKLSDVELLALTNENPDTKNK